MELGCVIIDDEHLAREYLKDYISKVPFLRLEGDFNSPLKALDLLKSGRIDLMFLDIEMPDITGLDFLKTLDTQPKVILTTAYKEYALEGYELNVTDYLLKPFSFDRFLKAVNKVVLLASQTSSAAVPASRLKESDPAEIHDTYLVVRADRKFYKINYDELVYVEGQKAYVTFHTTTRQITALASLKDLAARLPSNRFVRIHKSFIVSVRHISAMEGHSVFVGKKVLPVGKSFYKNAAAVFRLGT